MNRPDTDSTGRESVSSRLRATIGCAQIIGENAAFVSALNLLPTVAKHDVSVLILGETGTGKEVFARAIHYQSRRSAQPFIPVNCGALPTDLFENEFFGHESGAYTGAAAGQAGLLKIADGGSLFLDEVDCLHPSVQVKLLRFLQDGQFRPLGCGRLTTANVRVIAASNADLREATRSGRFRLDLYYRLNVVSIQLPPLRLRDDDVVLLAKHFLDRCHENLGGDRKEFSSAASHKLLSYQWPGNVRELENVVQRAFILAKDRVIEASDISVGPREVSLQEMSFGMMKAKVVDDFEKAYLRRALRLHGGNITRAARSAGKDRRAFWELMRKHQIGVEPGPRAGDSTPRQTTDQPGQICHSDDFSEKLSEPASRSNDQDSFVRSAGEALLHINHL